MNLKPVLNIDKVSKCASGGVWRNRSIAVGGGGAGGEDPDDGDGGDGDDDDNAPFEEDFCDEREDDTVEDNDEDDHDNDDMDDINYERKCGLWARAKRMKKNKANPGITKYLNQVGRTGNYLVQCIAAVTTFRSFLQLTAEANRNVLEAAKVEVREVTQAAFTGNPDVSHIDTSLFCLKHLPLILTFHTAFL